MATTTIYTPASGDIAGHVRLYAIHDGGGTPEHPIVQDSSGRCWIVFLDMTGASAGTYKLAYASTPDGSWTVHSSPGLPTMYIGSTFESRDADRFGPNLFIDTDDHLWLQYKNGSDDWTVTRTQQAATTSAMTWETGFDWTPSATGGDHSGAAGQLWDSGSDKYIGLGQSLQQQTVKWNGSAFSEADNRWGAWANFAAAYAARQSNVGVISTRADMARVGDGGGNKLDFQAQYWDGAAWQLIDTLLDVVDADAPIGNYEFLANLVFDGTRWCVLGKDPVATYKLNLSEIDVAVTGFTSRNSTPTHANDFAYKTGVDVATGDLYVVIFDTANAWYYCKFDRASLTWDASWTSITGVSGTIDTYNSDFCGWSLTGWPINGSFWIVFRDTATDGDSLKIADGPSVNSDPTAPTIDAPADGSVQDVAESLGIVWTFNDPDDGDSQSAYSLRKQIGTGSYSYWNGSLFTGTESASTKIASSGTTHTLSASWGSDGDADHKYAVKTWDAADAGPSPWSETRVVPSAQDNPTIVAITTVTSDPYTVNWTVATQTKYRVKVYDDATGSPDTSTVFYNSGVQVSAVTNASVPFPTNNVTRHVGVVTYNDEGLASDEDFEQVEVDYVAPPAPTVSMSTTGTESGVIFVDITNPAPGAGETIADSNEVFRRVAVDGGDGIRIALNIASGGAFNDYGPLSEVVYQYRARAISDATGAGTYGSWTT